MIGGPCSREAQGLGGADSKVLIHSQDPGLGGVGGGGGATAVSSAEPGGPILPVLTAGTQLGGDSLRFRSSLEEADLECSVLTSLERSSGGLPFTPAQDHGVGLRAAPPRVHSGAPVTPITPG